MRSRLLKDAGGWGALLWLVGYVLGLVLFAFVPPGLIGWIMTPFGAAMTVWVAFRKVTGDSRRYFVLVGLVWMAIAVVGDYLFIVKAFAPPDGYYKLDVYVYYALTFVIPLAAGWRTPRAARVPSLQ